MHNGCYHAFQCKQPVSGYSWSPYLVSPGAPCGPHHHERSCTAGGEGRNQEDASLRAP
jgi:hypothetical protein